MKTLLVLLFGGAKFAKLAVAGGSMMLSLAVYALLWGWRFAAGFVALLLIHELGHYIAARQRGLAVGLPTFIPFIGAWIELKEQEIAVETEAYVALAGPVVGTVASLLLYLVARQVESDLLLAVSYAGLFLNLINLLPVSPLDGGRVTNIISPRLWFLGAPLLVALFLYHPSPAFVLVAIAAVPQLFKAWRFDPKAPEFARYAAVPLELKLEYGLLYVSLTVLLALMTYQVHGMLEVVRHAAS